MNAQSPLPKTSHNAPAFSDEALALAFAERYADRLRYCAAWTRWLEWTGKVWVRDDTLAVFDLARVICREAASACNDERAASGIASAKTVAAVERLARADRRLAATADQWDFDSWLLNTPDSAIDLRTGEARVHRAADYLTRITTAAPGGDCPLFRAFLDRIADSAADMIAYLARVFGYSLTGSTRDHALFFVYGTGANGKSVLLNTVSKIMGSYAKSAPVEAFLNSKGDRIPNDIAGLRSARFVTSIETDEGKRWAEARVKQLTGGDRVSARFMRAEWFEFEPTFKICIAGNNQPSLANVDEAMRRRIHIIPFAVTIPATERDPRLAETLETEAGGILSWMLAGCADWQRRGLAPPAAVQAATEAYLAAEDSIAAWAAECLEADRAARESSTNLFKSWSAFAARVGEPPGSQKALSERLIGRGWRKADNRTSKGFGGYRIRAKPEDL